MLGWVNTRYLWASSRRLNSYRFYYVSKKPFVSPHIFYLARISRDLKLILRWFYSISHNFMAVGVYILGVCWVYLELESSQESGKFTGLSRRRPRVQASSLPPLKNPAVLRGFLPFELLPKKSRKKRNKAWFWPYFGYTMDILWTFHVAIFCKGPANITKDNQFDRSKRWT